MATDCPTCLGVSRGGRIRITEVAAPDVMMGLRGIRHQWLQLRRLALDTGAVESAKLADDHLKGIDFEIEELARTSRELGWSTSAT